MEVQCPRCESTFAVDPTVLRAHQGALQCSVCGETFRVPVAGAALSKTRDSSPPRNGGIGRWFLLVVILVLVLVLIVQVLWWTRSYAYLASAAPVRSFLLQSAQRFGVTMPWPGPNAEIHIGHSTVTPLPNHLAVIRGTLENTSGMVQAYPQIQVVLSNAYGSTIATLQFAPSAYLPKGILPYEGFSPESRVDFVLQGPKLQAVPGYQVTILRQP
jgi:predicted Zn finger-like uncharacterized protein